MDDAQFVAMFLTERPMLLRVARAIVGAGESEDAVQEAFIRAWRRRATFDGRAGGAWLGTIARNVAIDELRRRALRVATTADDTGWWQDPAPGPEAAYLAREAEDALTAAIAALPPTLAPAVALVCATGLDYRSACAALGVPKTTLRMRLSHGRAKLRAVLPC